MELTKVIVQTTMSMPLVNSILQMTTSTHDEIHHVAFGLKWLRILKPAGLSDWDAYSQHLHWPLRPDKSIGDVFHRQPRLAAGMTDEFIDRLCEESPPQSPAKSPNSI